MTRAGSGLSTAADPIRAVDQAVARARTGLGEGAADFAFAFFSGDHHDHASMVLARLAAAAGTPYVVGCTAAGVIADGIEVESGPSLAVLLVASDAIRATTFLYDGEDLGYTTGSRLGERLVGSRRTGDLVVALPDPEHVRPDRLLRGLAETLPGVAVVGGASSFDAGGGATYQFRGEDYRSGAVSGFRLGGDLAFRVAVSQGCRPLGSPMRVTEAHENLILEVEGRPALDVLRERAPDGALDDLAGALDWLFVGIVPGPSGSVPTGGEFVVRNLLTIDPDTGVIAVGSRVDEGQRVVFAVREARAAREDLARSLRDLEAERDSVRFRFGLYFDCLARGRRLYGEDGVDARLLREALPDIPIVGFFSNAELAPANGVNRLYTYSGVLVLVGEPVVA